MSKIVECKIICGDTGASVERTVQGMLDKEDEEWEVHGNLAARQGGLYQAMVRRESPVGFSKRTYRGNREDE